MKRSELKDIIKELIEETIGQITNDLNRDVIIEKKLDQEHLVYMKRILDWGKKKDGNWEIPINLYDAIKSYVKRNR